VVFLFLGDPKQECILFSNY